MRRRSAIVLFASAVALAACGKTAVTGKVVDFSHGPMPADWKKTDVKGMAVAYYHEGYGATAGVAPVCEGISDYSLESLAQQELIGIEQRETVEQTRVTVDGRDAIDWVVKGSVDGVTVKVNLVVFRKDGCVYDLNLVSRPDSFEKAREDFRSFVSGFALKD